MITGPATGDNALVKTVGPCTLQPTLGDPDPYACISHNAATDTATIGARAIGNSAVAYTLAVPTVDFGMTTPVVITAAALKIVEERLK